MSLWSGGGEGGVRRRKWRNGGKNGAVVLILVSELSGMEEPHGSSLREPLG